MFEAKLNTYQQVGLSFDNLNNKYGEESLIAACREGNLQSVKWHLAHGQKVNYLYQNKHVPSCFFLTPNQISPLCLAAIKGHAHVVKYLVVDQNADVNFLSSENVSPLYGACRSGKSLKIVIFLLEKGANPRQERELDDSSQGINILTAAEKGGNNQIVKFLKEAIQS
ncbi:ankyrin repeat domain-containing protein [Parashewanella spongiae]|uniref:Ankyrin repeat domain-containing protein n=1 Tax=Parashewanella spongiae TaxID=342950 RepID=A0A3A6TDS2_9GAMM|nr:ankyrin repeat domain-containing protein [Parashewanella spongiae]MCL1080107.1 ankyrin repeat domain-containing protein [Parashewanella spongiae]RJY04930.1 ankyrin repeat domain-containing protein [Parashewanella spongiae]